MNAFKGEIRAYQVNGMLIWFMLFLFDFRRFCSLILFLLVKCFPPYSQSGSHRSENCYPPLTCWHVVEKNFTRKCSVDMELLPGLKVKGRCNTFCSRFCIDSHDDILITASTFSTRPSVAPFSLSKNDGKWRKKFLLQRSHCYFWRTHGP